MLPPAFAATSGEPAARQMTRDPTWSARGRNPSGRTAWAGLGSTPPELALLCR